MVATRWRHWRMGLAFSLIVGGVALFVACSTGEVLLNRASDGQDERTDQLAQFRLQGAEVGRGHNAGVKALRVEYLRRLTSLASRPTAAELELAKAVLREYFSSARVPAERADQVIEMAIRQRGHGGRFWAVRDRAFDEPGGWRVSPRVHLGQRALTSSWRPSR